MQLRLVPIFVGILVSFAASQVSNGGFESSPTGVTLPASWVTSATPMTSVLDVSAGFDCGMPAEGQKWLMLSAQGSNAATGPSVPSGFGIPPIGARSVHQTFSTVGTATRLDVTAVFLSDESQNSTYRDFLSVDISDGVLHRNLIYLDVSTPFSGPPSNLFTRTLGGAMPSTATVTASVDLVILFPLATSTTVFTITLSVGNGGDASLPSRGYFDAVLSLPGSAIPWGASFAVTRVDPSASGQWLLLTDAPAHPGAILRHLFSASVSLPVGTGPFLGMSPDALTYGSIYQSFGAHPFHVTTDTGGRYLFTIPAAAVAGFTIDVVAVVFPLSGGYVVTTPFRRTF